MGTKIYLKIALYLLLQLCFFATTTFFLDIIRNGNLINGINDLFVYAVSVITICVISIIKFKIINSLLQLTIKLTITFELLISLRILSISSSLVYDNNVVLFNNILTIVINAICFAGFVAYMIMINKTYAFQFEFKPKKYLLLTFLYKIIEPVIVIIMAFIFVGAFKLLRYIYSSDISEEYLYLSLLSVIGIIVFLFIYIRKKIILNSKRQELRFYAVEAIILFIGTTPIIFTIPIIIPWLYLFGSILN